MYTINKGLIVKPNFLCVGAAPTVDRSDILALVNGKMGSLILYNLRLLVVLSTSDNYAFPNECRNQTVNS